MSGLFLSFTAAEAAVLALAAALAALLGVLVWRAILRRRITPQERERRRRAALAGAGKIMDATLVDIHEDALFYSYIVRGMEYTASQDITALKDYMPEGLGLGIGPVSVKYDPKNPADSIVLSEDWSGLRAGKSVR